MSIAGFRGRTWTATIASLGALALASTTATAQSIPEAADGAAVLDASVEASASAEDAAVATTITEDATASADASAPDAGGSTVQIAMTRVAIVDTAPIGVDPAAATFVNNVLREQFTRLGLAIVATDELYAAARRLSLAFPVPEAGLAQLVTELRSEFAITCELRARSGFYFATLRVRRRDESTERAAGVVATQWTLGDRVREAVLLLLRGGNGASSINTGAGPSDPTGIPPTQPYYQPPISIPARPPILLHARPFELSLVGHAAFNPGREPYTNGLVGARFTYFPLDRLGVMASLSYANLRGRAGRVNNLLPLVGVESGVDLVPSIGLFVPLRFEVGYLPFNGIVARVTAGLAFTLYRQLRLEIDVVQPTLWMVGENASVSLDIGASITWTFGRDRTPRQRRRRRTTPASGTSTSTTSTTSTGAATASTTAPR